MASRREDHLRDHEDQARRQLEHLGRRWPANPTVYLVAAVVVAMLILLLAVM